MKDGLTQVKELKDKIHEQYIEIKELNKRAEDLKTINEEHQILNGMLREENGRLNNIINELEKYIIDFKEDYEKNRFQPNAKVYIYWKDLIDKIQELKGENNE